MRPQLLCTFTSQSRLLACLDSIQSTFGRGGVDNLRCYQYSETPDKVICIYGIKPTTQRLKDTILINHKKETNTFYSINALNGLIRTINSGILDKSYQISWHNYEDSLLLSNGDCGYKAIKIQQLTQ